MGDVWHYLDHAATTPLRPEALAAMLPALRDGLGNPSGSHALARAARAALDGARERLATVVGCQPGELVFTSGGTEADNLAVRGALGARPGRAVCSAIEHHAVLHPIAAVDGAVVAVDDRGIVDLADLARALVGEVALVSVMLVNNETGTIQPLAEVADVVRSLAPGALLHTDAAQALCWVDVREAVAVADLVTLASHKCGGPVGTGALVVRDGVSLQAQQVGGGQERERRSGTQDVAGALGFAAAAETAAHERAALVARAAGWRDALVDALLAGVPGAVESAVPTAADRAHLVAGVANVCLPEVDSEALLYVLEHEYRVLASAASSCASGAQEPSHVLAALGIDRSLAAGSLRLSLGWSTTAEDVDAAVAGVIAAARRLQAHGAGRSAGMTERVLVAMSGGVDSSVAAALLVEAGHDVVGATLKLWGGASDSGCCSVADVDDARTVARRLGIEHHVFNFGDDFDEHVVGPYVADHAAGRTPNPCIECNRHVKFDRLLRRADALGFDAVATGHHARVVHGADGTPRVARGADPAKDQSYVVHVLTPDALRRVRFPVGHLTKDAVRAEAARLGLPTAAKPDSQDVCFITATGGRKSFLGDRIATRPGRVVDGAGATMGSVDAVELVTLGQRHGLGLPGGTDPRYVVAVDVATATVTVGSASDLRTDRVDLAEVVWVGPPPTGPLVAQVSAHGTPRPCRVDGATVVFDVPARRVAPGQSVVLYEGDVVVGGGIVA